VMCNFLTTTSMTAQFELEITGLARSLTPGGLLLVLGGTGEPYPMIYQAIDDATAPAHVTLVLDDVLRAQGDEQARRITADRIVSCLRYLKEGAPAAYAGVQMDLPRNVWTLDPARLTFPSFQMRVYKREGNAAFNAREKRRMARRRT
jgi:hypothetical protein